MGRPLYYITDEEGNALPATNEQANEWWKKPFEETKRVAFDQIGDVHVSTVFLAIDHSFDGGPPVLWETMVFGGEYDGEQERYTSREDAQAGHARWVAKVNQEATA